MSLEASKPGLDRAEGGDVFSQCSAVLKGCHCYSASALFIEEDGLKRYTSCGTGIAIAVTKVKCKSFVYYRHLPNRRSGYRSGVQSFGRLQNWLPIFLPI